MANHLKRQPKRTHDEPPPPTKPTKTEKIMRGNVDMRSQLFQLAGVDLFEVSGLSTDTLLTLAGEVGFDMNPWKTEKHFTSMVGCLFGH